MKPIPGMPYQIYICYSRTSGTVSALRAALTQGSVLQNRDDEEQIKCYEMPLVLNEASWDVSCNPSLS